VHLRDLFTQTFSAVATSPRSRFPSTSLTGFEKLVYTVSTSSKESSREANLDRIAEWKKELQNTGDQALNAGLCVLAALADLAPLEHMDAIRSLSVKAASVVWNSEKYEKAFKKNPELNELITTPFMLQVCIFF
jgi:hypothetical protein